MDEYKKQLLLTHGVVEAFKKTTQTGAADPLIDLGIAATPDSNNIYHINQDYWQSLHAVGYNDLYYAVFKAATEATGTSMAKDKFMFNVGDKEYVIWVCKGDYINLGAGAEAGIYKEYGLGHWLTSPENAMPMTLTLTDKNTGEQIYSYGEPDEKYWWITGFDPSHPNNQENELEATVVLDFSQYEDDAMWEGFKERYLDDEQWTFDVDKKKATLVW